MRRETHTHPFFPFLLTLIKKKLLLQSTERHAGGISPTLLLNTQRERLCTLSNTAYDAQRFIPNKTLGSQVLPRDVEGRWRQAEEQPSPEAGREEPGNHDITGAAGTDACVPTCRSQKVKFAVSPSHRCRCIHRGTCVIKGDHSDN